MRATLRAVAVLTLAAVTVPVVAAPAAAAPTATTEIRIEGLTPRYAAAVEPGDVTTVDVSGTLDGVRIDPTTCTFVPAAAGGHVAGCDGSDLTVDLVYDAADPTALTAVVSSGASTAKTTYTLRCGIAVIVVWVVLYCVVYATSS
jgi:hypothetical protein